VQLDESSRAVEFASEVEFAKQGESTTVELAKSVELPKHVELDASVELTKHVELAKSVELPKHVELDASVELTKHVELTRAVELQIEPDRSVAFTAVPLQITVALLPQSTLVALANTVELDALPAPSFLPFPFLPAALAPFPFLPAALAPFAFAFLPLPFAPASPAPASQAPDVAFWAGSHNAVLLSTAGGAVSLLKRTVQFLKCNS
jgi:hypothetical protein